MAAGSAAPTACSGLAPVAVREPEAERAHNFGEREEVRVAHKQATKHFTAPSRSLARPAGVLALLSGALKRRAAD